MLIVARDTLERAMNGSVEEDDVRSEFECKKCGGKGHLGEKCERCKGTGIEPDSMEEKHVGCRLCFEKPYQGFKPCSECNGIGAVCPLALRKIDGPNEVINSLLGTLLPRFTITMANAHDAYLKELRAVKENALQQGLRFDKKAALRLNWDWFLKKVDSVLTEYFQTLFEVGKNSEYAKHAIPDPADWAYNYTEFYYSQIEKHTQGKIIPPLAKLLRSTDGALLLEFRNTIEVHRGELLDKALLELARLGWKPLSATASTPEVQTEIPPKQGVEESTPPTPQSSSLCPFTLADLDDPGDLPLRLVVHELYRYLRKTALCRNLEEALI
jgi:hypothetical protein